MYTGSIMKNESITTRYNNVSNIVLKMTDRQCKNVLCKMMAYMSGYMANHFEVSECVQKHIIEKAEEYIKVEI